MPFFVRCPNCAKDYRLGDEFAGRTVRCKCGQHFLIDVPPPEPEEEPADSLLELLDDADRQAADALERLSETPGTLVQVRMTGRESVDEQAFLEAMRASAEQDILRIFGARAAGTQLQISSEIFQHDFSRTLLKYRIEGQLCGRAVNKTVSSMLKSIVGAGVEGAIGAAGVLLVKGVGAAMSGKRPQGSPALDQCLRGCQVNLRLFLEEQVPRRAGSGADRYQQIKWTSIALGLLFTFGTTVAFELQGAKSNWAGSLLLGALAGLTFGMSAYFAIVSFMPTDFYHNTPRGRWLLTKHPTGNLPVLRKQFLFIATLGFLWAFGCAALPTIGAAFRDPNPPAQPQAPPPGFLNLPQQKRD